MLINSFECLLCDGHWTTSLYDDPGLCPGCRRQLIEGLEDLSPASLNLRRSAMDRDRDNLLSQITAIERHLESTARLPLLRRVRVRLHQWWRDPGFEGDLARLQRELSIVNRRIGGIDAISKNLIPQAQARFRSKTQAAAKLASIRRQQADRRAQDRADRFEEMLRADKHSRLDFVVRPQDYKRGHLLDNFFRGKWFRNIDAAFGGTCALCHSHDGSLTLDHFWLSKNEGGNFAMLHHASSVLVSNVILLCRSCNSAKGDRPFDTFFAHEQIQTIRIVEQRLTRAMMSDRAVCGVASKWYGRALSPVRPEQSPP